MVYDDDWDSILLSQDMDKAISDAEETFKLKPNDSSSRISGSPQQQSILRNIEEKKQRAIAIRAERQAIKNLSSQSIESQRRACFRNGLSTITVSKGSLYGCWGGGINIRKVV